MIAKALLGLLLAAAAPSDGVRDAVAAFYCTSGGPLGRVNIHDVSAAYGFRSVAIIDAAIAEDRTRLRQMVAASARFQLIQGDVGIGPQSGGVEAAMEFVRQVDPQTYEFSEGSPGPFPGEPCGTHSVQLTMFGEGGYGSVVATFHFHDGILTAVTASGINLRRGQFKKRALR